MAELVYLYSCAADDEGTGQPGETGPGRAAQTGGRAVGVASVPDLIAQLGKLKADGVLIDRLVVDTHGKPGGIWFGDDLLTTPLVQGMKLNGYESLFAPDARIFFQGCNVAAEDTGRKFLEAVALTFLFKGGGRAGGCTTTGHVYPDLSYKTFFFTLDAVYAYVRRGGTRVRIAVGMELDWPVGQWRVKDGDGKDWYYTFYPNNKVSYDDSGYFWARSADEGDWQQTDQAVRITWDSGDPEDWPLPLFTHEQPILWPQPDGSTATLLAEKIGI
jgi:Domain of unknown function (DUF4347)